MKMPGEFTPEARVAQTQRKPKSLFLLSNGRNKVAPRRHTSEQKAN